MSVIQPIMLGNPLAAAGCRTLAEPGSGAAAGTDQAALPISPQSAARQIVRLNRPPRLPLWAAVNAIIEVTAQPHTGCQKFVSRFGLDAMKFVNSPVGRELNLRGINARVVQPGAIRVGDAVRVIAPVE